MKKIPTDVAIELLDRFQDIGKNEEDAKKCALIVCDVLMDFNINLEGSQPRTYMEEVYNFYYNVKRNLIG